MRWRIIRWLLAHPHKTTWIAIELTRELPWRVRAQNAVWQYRHYDDMDAWQRMYNQWSREQ